jgi:hypothetical protein
VAVVSALLLTTTACGSGHAHRAGAVATPTTQGCLGSASDTGKGTIAWGQLHNPILAYPDSGIRDVAIRLVHGSWHILFTSVVGDTPDWRIADVTTPDWRSWSPPSVWPAQPNTDGLASPDVTQRHDGTYVVTYQSDPGEQPRGQDKLYYRTSKDLVRWSVPQRLGLALHPAPGDRMIDAALAWVGHGLVLGYKFGASDQHFEVAWSSSGSLDGPWTLIGRPDIKVYNDTIENYQFLPIDGVWHLLATSNNLDRPFLFTLVGDPTDPQSWLHWKDGRELQIPTEAWNGARGLSGLTFERANAAYLCDARRLDGHYYMLFVGSPELHTYGGFGHTELGVARSTDLVHWTVPPG